MTTPTQNTIAYLRLCQNARSAGYPVSYTTDPAWLVQMAINRRAGWPDDPSHSRGSCMPVATRISGTLIRASRYPKRAQGSRFMHLWRIAHTINGTRIIVRSCELGEDKKLLLARIPERITQPRDEAY